jgi:hypothetical protein
MDALRVTWSLLLVGICIVGCVAANVVGVLPMKQNRSGRLNWVHNHHRFLHGWPLPYLQRSTEQNWPHSGIVLPNKPYMLATRLPFDRAGVFSFDRKTLVADVIITGALGLLSIATVLRASSGAQSRRGRTSAAWAFLAMTTVIGRFIAVHRQHVEWVFRYERELIPYDDLAMSVVITIGLVYLPAACRRLNRSPAKVPEH